MNLKRRHFLSLTTGTLLSNFYKNISYASKINSNPAAYLSSAGNSQGDFFLSCFSNLGKEKFRIGIPNRGHGFARNSISRDAAIFARRPGNFCYIINTSNGEIIDKFNTKNGRHFYGHGFYSNDGMWLYSTENEYNSGRGLIGVYDVTDRYRLVETFPSYGIGPHEINLLSEGNILVVANGGVLTHPDSGRQKLNLDTMESSLVYIDIKSGKLLSSRKLSDELRLMSIRHIAVSPSNEIAVVMQYQGPSSHIHPLVGFQKGSDQIILCSAPEKVLYRMKNYCGSVTFDSSSKLIAVSSPRGGIITFWSTTERCFLSLIKIQDGCGVAPGINPESFIITNGHGRILDHSPLIPKTELLSNFKNTHWDNHLLMV